MIRNKKNQPSCDCRNYELKIMYTTLRKHWPMDENCEECLSFKLWPEKSPQRSDIYPRFTVYLSRHNAKNDIQMLNAEEMSTVIMVLTYLVNRVSNGLVYRISCFLILVCTTLKLLHLQSRLLTVPRVRQSVALTWARIIRAAVAHVAKMATLAKRKYICRFWNVPKSKLQNAFLWICRIRSSTKPSQPEPD